MGLTGTPTVLVVDDEADLASAVQYNLEREGFRALGAPDGKAALALAEEERPDLVILDLMLPDISGIEVCRRLRATAAGRSVPVLMLTARGEEVDRVMGFTVGADDYLVKPFSMRELLLRVRAILRRSDSSAAPPHGGLTRFGVLELDTDGHRAWVAGQEIVLTALEFKLLQAFLTRPGRVQTREGLLQGVWGMGPDVVTRTVDTHVKRLRLKIGEAGRYIQTIRGVGYRFAATPDERAADD